MEIIGFSFLVVVLLIVVLSVAIDIHTAKKDREFYADLYMWRDIRRTKQDLYAASRARIAKEKQAGAK